MGRKISYLSFLILYFIFIHQDKKGDLMPRAAINILPEHFPRYLEGHWIKKQLYKKDLGL
jgi:hypothetical protein